MRESAADHGYRSAAARFTFVGRRHEADPEDLRGVLGFGGRWMKSCAKPSSKGRYSKEGVV
jgi:hypothetical protein